MLLWVTPVPSPWLCQVVLALGGLEDLSEDQDLGQHHLGELHRRHEFKRIRPLICDWIVFSSFIFCLFLFLNPSCGLIVSIIMQNKILSL